MPKWYFWFIQHSCVFGGHKKKLKVHTDISRFYSCPILNIVKKIDSEGISEKKEKKKERKDFYRSGNFWSICAGPIDTLFLVT